MNVVRLNLSHGCHKDHEKVIGMIRSLARQLDRPVAILADLQGPKIRTGRLKAGQPIQLKRGQTFHITSKDVCGTEAMVSTTYPNLVKDVCKKDRILLDDGCIALQVVSTTKDAIACKVLCGGLLKENKGINLPGVRVSVPSLTEKDRRDIKFGIKWSVDFFAISFVRSADDIKSVKHELEKQKVDIPVMAKIEKAEAVENLDSILEIADGVMVARGSWVLS